VTLSHHGHPSTVESFFSGWKPALVINQAAQISDMIGTSRVALAPETSRLDCPDP
jgi:hypothetical protein